MINEYAGIDWNRVLTNAEKHPEQTESTAIGVGTDGRSVNMDLWVYSLLEDGTYGLNTKENINTDTSQGVTSGYKGSFTEDGQIEGTIPQYISEDNGETYKEVTDLKWLFFNCSEMKIAPKIPTTVKKMNYTFRNCLNLTKTPYIPDSVTELSRTFQDCKNIKSITNLPSNLSDLSYAFDNCINLSMVNLMIPESVINVQRAFYRCENLNGEIVINANVTGKIINNETDYVSMFGYAVTNDDCKLTLTGSCKMLYEIISEAGNLNITIKDK